ncbi:MAG TPA: tetratricopeptide repeat protein, partial [Streptosporangiaceae bacterium]|nr:tetratricopeptide repeat protein [Streptosporangiaceae bacterium]
MVTQQAGTVTSSGSGVLLSGTVPPLADAYHPREQSGPDLASSMRPGQTVVLVHGEESGQASRVPAAQGGTGKTQLAVEFTHAMWHTRAVEVLVWVTAASRESVITGFAQAANTVDASQPEEGAETAAARFVSWLAHTRRPWALVIDDLAELSDLEDLWPSGASGRVLITTRLPADAFEDAMAEGPAAEGGAAEGMDLRVVPVPGLNRREALDYVTSRLTDHPDQRIEALDLGEDLDGLPLALAQATAAMSARGQGCREYRSLLAERIGHMPAVPGASAAVLATWSIAAECAHDLPPAGLAWPTLALAAMLDHHGVPGAVLTSPAACGYIAGRPSTANGADQAMVRAAINNLAQAGLVTIDPVSPVRTVQMHASVQAAVRAYLPVADLEQVVLAAADALLQTWPDGDGPGQRVDGQLTQVPFQQAQLEQALRDCAATLRTSDGGLLWKPEAHPLLFRAGLSLEHSRLSDAAITYWKSMVATSTRLLGPAHANAVVARDRLAAAYEAAGKSADAIAVFQTAMASADFPAAS